MQLRELKKIYTLPPVEFDLIAAHVLRKSREFVLIHTEYKLTNKEEDRIDDYIERRLAGEPLAYLFGYKEFFGLNFLVNQHTLIPRPETELLIEEALACIKQQTNNPAEARIIDLGTGSGCIAIALTKKLFWQNEESNVTPQESHVYAIDISNKALKLARKNAKLNFVDKLIKFKEGNLLDPLLDDETYSFTEHYHVIAANLPYLTPKQVRNSPTIKFEPETALISGEDGLQHYRELFRQIKSNRIDNYTLLCEIDDTQGESMTALIKKELPGRQFEIKKDLSGYDRLAIISS